jgi:hypothetical protein
MAIQTKAASQVATGSLYVLLVLDDDELRESAAAAPDRSRDDETADRHPLDVVSVSLPARLPEPLGRPAVPDRRRSPRPGAHERYVHRP